MSEAAKALERAGEGRITAAGEELVRQLRVSGVGPAPVALVQVLLERLNSRSGAGIAEVSTIFSATRLAEGRQVRHQELGLKPSAHFSTNKVTKSTHPDRTQPQSQAHDGGGPPSEAPPPDLYTDPAAEREDFAGLPRHVHPKSTPPRNRQDKLGAAKPASESVQDIILPEYVQSPAYLTPAEQTYADLGPIVLPRRDAARDDAVALAEGMLDLLPPDAWQQEVYQSARQLQRAEQGGYLTPDDLRLWVDSWAISMADAARLLSHTQKNVEQRYGQRGGYLPQKLSEALEAVRYRDKWEVLRASHSDPGPARHVFFKVVPATYPSALAQAYNYGLWPPELRYYRHWSRKQCRLMELRMIARQTRGPMPLGKRAELTLLERWCANKNALRPSGCFIVHTPSGLSAGCQGRGRFDRNRQLAEAALSKAVTRWRILEEKHEKFSCAPTDYDLVKKQLADTVAADVPRNRPEEAQLDHQVPVD